MNRRALPCLVILASLWGLGCHQQIASKPVPASSEPKTPAAAPATVEAPQDVADSVKGVLRQIGNVPFVEVVITGQSAAFGKGDYHLIGPRAQEIASLPLGPIEAKGMLRHLEAQLAGNSGKTRRWLEIDVSEYTR